MRLLGQLCRHQRRGRDHDVGEMTPSRRERRPQSSRVVRAPGRRPYPPPFLALPISPPPATERTLVRRHGGMRAHWMNKHHLRSEGTPRRRERPSASQLGSSATFHWEMTEDDHGKEFLKRGDAFAKAGDIPSAVREYLAYCKH